MRSADAATVFRAALGVAAAYLILIRYNAAVIVALIAITIFLDAFDGYLAIREESSGAVGIVSYAKSLMGDMKAQSLVAKYRKRTSTSSRYGARVDVAGDRIVEYTFWVVFTYLHIVPLFVTILVIIRHSFADAVMGSRGTSSTMRTAFARFMYSSNLMRGGINAVKFFTFSYLALVYVSGYPIMLGYILTAILVIYIMLRGLAEILEA